MNKLPVIRSLTVLCFILSAFVCVAEDEALLSPKRDISDVIDHYVAAKLESDHVVPAVPATSQTMLRRTTLDLAGRIPSVSEQQWYAELPDDRRHIVLVDRLISLPDFELHLRNELDALLLPNRPDDKTFRDYLLWAIHEQRSWDQMFKDMILASNVEGPQSGAAQFLHSRIREVDDLTNDTAVLFFGVNISCAKCHDHPLVEDWKQDHFYGMQAFFSRTYNTKKNIVAERLFDEVKFRTTSGEDKVAAYMFLTGAVVENATPAFSDEERKAVEGKIRDAEQKDDAEIPVPEFSPRGKLIDIALNDDTSFFFARNIVNRIWARLIGNGIVEPHDQMHAGNTPSHPELLSWLSRDLRENGYNLRRLIRGIVLSGTYARSSNWTQPGAPPAAQAFALGKTQPLSPRQLAASLLIAGSGPNQWPAVDAMEEWTKRREDLENQANGWAREFEVPVPGFQVAVDEALFFSNNSRIENDVLRDSPDRLVGHLKTIEDDVQLATNLWAIVLGRTLNDDEKESAVEWLGREGDRVAHIRQLVWVLVAGPEFRFNH